jgi:hypothetical protein
LFSSNQLVATPTPVALVTIIKTWERHPALPANQQQVIGISVLNNFKPVAGVEAELFLILPDGLRTNFQFPPTDDHGQANLTLPRLSSLRNGALVEYQVCLPSSYSEKFCVGESFIIWNNP